MLAILGVTHVVVRPVGVEVPTKVPPVKALYHLNSVTPVEAVASKTTVPVPQVSPLPTAVIKELHFATTVNK